jgi:hypothetical protein
MKKLIFILLLIALVSGCSQLGFNEEGVVHVEIFDWGYNEENEDELIFSYWIYNFGNFEAKDINVRCKLFESFGDEEVASTSLHKYGNLASRSVRWEEFLTPRPDTVNLEDEYTSICYVESCENCEVLFRRIPELIESFES